MTVVSREDQVRPDSDGRPGSAAAVLADRLAAALVHHEPGWRLPRLTALARRYSVSVPEMDAAIDELAGQHLVRRLSDGQVYRASPAEYRIPLEGVLGLTSYVDPMGSRLACRSRHVTLRRPPEDIGRSLGLAPGEPVLAVRCAWTVAGEPAALAAGYLPEWVGAKLGVSLGQDAAGPDTVGGDGHRADLPSPASFPLPWEHPGPGGPRPAGVQIELGPPPASAARTLRLAASDPAATVTVRFTDPASSSPVALTITILRPELFRVVVETAPSMASVD